MAKQDTENKSHEAHPTDALVDTGKAPEEKLESTAEAHAEKHQTHKGGKHVKIDSAELDALKTRAADADKFYDQFLRARAEFDNYRKRVVQEKQYAELAANEKLLQKLLGILDTFELALASAEKAESTNAVLDGVKLVQSQLQNVLKESGIEEIDALHKEFDPNLHEAIQQMESKDHAEGTVIQQIRKGYKFKDRLLRPATVVVARKAEASVPDETN